MGKKNIPHPPKHVTDSAIKVAEIESNTTIKVKMWDTFKRIGTLGFVALISYFVAGKNTNVDLSGILKVAFETSIFTKALIFVSITSLIGNILQLLYYRYRFENMSNQIQELEKNYDDDRTSSNLEKSGNTNSRD